jgi:hypothetical protein
MPMLKFRSQCLSRFFNSSLKLIFSSFILFSTADIVHSANYTRYVDTNINDNYYDSDTPDCSNYSGKNGSCGSGNDKAYRTIQDVNKFIQKLESGDSASIYFKRDCKWTINSKGSYLNVTKKNIYVGAFDSGAMPIFDGVDKEFNTASVNTHAPLIQIGANGVTVDSIKLINAYASAIRFSNVSNGSVKNCIIDKAGWAGVLLAGATSNVTVERCEITRAGYRGNEGPDPKSGSHPQAINANGSNVRNCIFRYNHVYNCYTEGIGGNGNISEFNLVGPTKASGIYAGEKGGIIRYNIIYGTTNSEFYKDKRNGRSWSSSGIALDEEKTNSPDSKGSQIYGNIVIGRFAGFRVRNMTKTLGKEAQIYNNTFIDNSYNIMISEPEYWKIHFQNNLSIVYDKTYSRHVVCWGDTYRFNIGPNQWSSIPEDKRWYSTSRDEISDPKLTKTNGWTSLTGVSSFSFSNLIPP